VERIEATIETSMFEDVLCVRMSRVLDGKPLYWVACYLVDGLLVDTGCSHTAHELVSFLEDKEINAVVNTHFHEDHIGANSLLAKRRKVPAYAHPASIPLMEHGFHLYPYQEVVWGIPEPCTALPVPDTIETCRYRFSVIETPGHSEGHICLFEPEKGWCFTGDLFSRENPKFIRPEENVADMVRSLRMIDRLPSERLVLFTSLGRIVEDGRAAVANCIKYLEELSRKVHGLAGSGLDEQGIVERIFGGEHLFASLTDGQYTSLNLVRSILKTAS